MAKNAAASGPGEAASVEEALRDFDRNYRRRSERTVSTAQIVELIRQDREGGVH